MKDEYIFLALIMHLVITIVIVVDWKVNLLNEVEVLTTRLSKDIFRPTHYKTNLKQGAHTLYTPTHGPGQYLTYAHSHITQAVAVMDSCFALIGAHQYGIAVIVLSLSRIKMSKIQVNVSEGRVRVVCEAGL